MFACSSLMLIFIFVLAQSTPVPISEDEHPGKLLDNMHFKIIVKIKKKKVLFYLILIFYKYDQNKLLIYQ